MPAPSSRTRTSTPVGTDTASMTTLPSPSIAARAFSSRLLKTSLSSVSRALIRGRIHGNVGGEVDGSALASPIQR